MIRWELFQIGLLSMFFAEVLSASSPFWFLNPFSWIVTFPLYLSHTVFLLNIVDRLKLTKFSQYYLLGTIFGLYESWITKVLWSGYPSEGIREPILGLVGGIAIFEFSILVFYFHPIFAFVSPILSYQILGVLAGSTPKFIPVTKTKLGKLFVSFSIVFTISMLAFNSQFNLLSIFVNVCGTLLIVLIIHFIIRSGNNPYSKEKLLLKSKGLTIISAYLIILYLGTYLVLAPEYIPNYYAYFPIIFFYILPLILLSVWNKSSIDENEIQTNYITKNQILVIVIISLILITTLSLLPTITTILFIVTQIIVFVASPIFYLIMIYSSLHV